MSESPRRAFSVHIFLPGGDPDGLKIVEKSNWSGTGLVFPRPLLSEARRLDEFSRPGVYVLEGPSELGKLPLVYVGEGDPIGPRMEQHAREKDFWTRAAVFTSKDQNVNKAHVQYLEVRLLERAREAKRCELDNSNTPQLPSLSQAHVAEVEGFLADMLLCFPLLGFDVFEKTAAAGTGVQEYVLKSRGIEARGFESSQGFVVRAGARAVNNEAASIHNYMSDIRRTLIESDVLVADGDAYRLTQDYAFASPSTAAGVLLGRTANGRTEWKTKAGQTLKAIQEAEAGPHEG